jgi:tight adherence protein C
MSPQLIFLTVVFVAVLMVGLMITHYLNPDLTRERLRRLTVVEDVASGSHSQWIENVVKLTGPLAKLSVPDEGWESAPLRIRFMNAGLREKWAPIAYFAAKTILALAFPALCFLFIAATGMRLGTEELLFTVLIAAAIGYYLPNVVLAEIVRRRKREIFENLPDAIDLMTVCVEAGLGLDAALVRVAEETEMTSRPLAEELRLVSLELRAGASKEKALRNFALRSGVDEVDALVAMLIQADRFGTSIADSLRIHSDGLRTKRRLRAEEAAAKIGVKLVFPLIFGIFPAMLVVLAGPAAIRIYRQLFPILSGQ